MEEESEKRLFPSVAILGVFVAEISNWWFNRYHQDDYQGRDMKKISITNVEQNHKIMAEEIMGLMDCPSDFSCYKKKLRPLCKTKDIGMKDYVLVTKNGHWCKYLMIVGEIYYCSCPLCVYLTKKNHWKEISRDKLY